MVIAVTDYVNLEQINSLRSMDDNMICGCCNNAKPGDSLYLCMDSRLRIHSKDEEKGIYSVILSPSDFMTYCRTLLHFQKEIEALGYRKSGYANIELKRLIEEVKKLNEH